MILLPTWYAHHGGAPIPHRAARPRTPSLHLEWHVAGVKVSRHRSVTSAMLARPDGGVLLARLGSGWLLYQRDHDHRWEVSRPDGADKHEGPTLAIALARLILARGSWT